MRSSYCSFSFACFFIVALFCIFPANAANPIYLQNYEIWHGDAIDEMSGIAISNDGNTIAAGSKDGTVYLIDGAGKLLWAYNNRRVSDLYFKPENGGDMWVSVALSSDGNYVVAGIRDVHANSPSESPTLLFFNRGGNLLWTYSARVVTDVEITDDGSRVAAIADNNVLSFNRDGSRAWKLRRSSEGAISIEGDGSSVAWTDGFGELALIDNTGTVVWEEKLKNTPPYASEKIIMNGPAILAHSNGLYDNNGRLLWNYTAPSSRSQWSGDLSSNGDYSVIGRSNEGVMIINRQGMILSKKNLTSCEFTPVVAISDDGSVIGSLCGSSLTLMTNNGDSLWTAKVPNYRSHIAISPHGDSIVTTSLSTIYYFKKVRETTVPPITADLKSNIRYDTSSYLGEYVYPTYVTADNLVIGAIVLVVLGIVGFSFWHLRKYVRGKKLTSRITGWKKYLLISIVVLVIAMLVNFLVNGYYRNFYIFSYSNPLRSLVLITTFILEICSVVIIVISAVALVVGFIRKKN
jgi:hypothetical protein